jgi:hypothetical protein
MHLAPESVKVEAVETPHYLYTLLNQKPLIKEGMLTVTAHTHGKSLVMANLLTTSLQGVTPKVITKRHNGFISGKASGEEFAFTTRPGSLYHIGDMKTNALALAWHHDRIFVAMATTFENGGNLSLTSDTPSSYEISGDGIKYYRNKGGKFIIKTDFKPSSVTLNGRVVKNFVYDNQHKRLVLEVPKGKGKIIIK